MRCSFEIKNLSCHFQRFLAIPRHPHQLQSFHQTASSQARAASIVAVSNDDLDLAMTMVRQHDPAGYLPGRLLRDSRMSQAYYAVRGFWIETGLRFGTTARVAPNSTPAQHLDWWQQCIDYIYTEQNERNDDIPHEFDHPTIRLLRHFLLEYQVPWTKAHFDHILAGRRKDLDVKQYSTLQELVEHAEQSCGSLSALVLESGLLTITTNPKVHQAAQLVGVCHGLTNALRLTIPVMSTTGRLIIPADLTTKYGVRSPRYLLSALGQGDEQCVQSLQYAVRDIAQTAQDHLTQARKLRDAILTEPNGEKAIAVLLPGLASEAFLSRLQQSQYKLTDRNLRNVSIVENGICALRMIMSFYKRTY